MIEIQKNETDLMNMGFLLKFEPQWQTFPDLDNSMKNKVIHTIETLSDILKGYHSNLNNPYNRLSWDFANAGFNSFVIIHVEGLGKYEFKLELKDKKLIFKADFKIFLFTGSSIDCPISLKAAMEKLL